MRLFDCVRIIVVTLVPIATLNAQRVVTIAGGSGDGGLALSADLFAPTSVAVDQLSNIYIADVGGRTIRKVDAGTGIISIVAGSGISGNSGNGGLALSASFGDPSGVAVDLNGNIYISDQLNSNIRKVNISTGIISQIAGDGGSGYNGDNILAIQARLFSPHSLYVAPNGDIYFADTGNYRVRKIDSSTGIISTVAGNGVYGFSGDNGPALSASISNVSSVCLDANGNIYIADYGNNRIRRISSSTSVITTVAGNGSSGFSGDGGLAIQAQLNEALGVIINKEGNLIIADTYNQRIREVNLSNGIINTLAGNGANGYLDGTLLQANFDVPQHLAIDQQGNIYISEFTNRRIRKITGTNVSTLAGNGGFGGDGSSALDASLKIPKGVIADKKGNIYIADTYNHRIRKVEASTGIISTISGNGNNQYNGDGGLAVNTQLNLPWSIIFDKDSSLVIAEAGNNRVRRIDRNSGVITTIAGNGSGGYSGDGGLAINASLNGPIGLAYDQANNLHISDSWNHCIRRVDAVTGKITTVAGVGTGGFSGDNGLASSAQLYYPQNIRFDKNNTMYICDWFNARIRKINPANNIITTVAGGGSSSNDGNALDVNLNSPKDILFDSLNNLLILEFTKVRKLDLSTGQISTLAGQQTRGFLGENGSALAAYFEDMSNFMMDDIGNIYICDSGNNRIRKIKARTKQYLTFNTLSGKTYGDPNFQLDAQASSMLTVAYTSSNINVAEIDGNIVKIVGGGTSTISAFQPGDLDYLPSPIVSRVLTVSKATQTIDFANLASKTFGDSPFILTATSSSGLIVTYSTTTPSKLNVAGNQVTLKSAGQAKITASQSGNSSYQPASPVDISFCINPAKPRVSISNNNTETPTLTSDADVGNQWYKDGIILQGSTQKSISVNDPGVYKVDVSIEGCTSSPSDDIAVIVTGDITNPISSSLEIFPNPVEDILVLTFPGEGHKEISIIEIGGSLINLIKTEKNKISVRVENLKSGLYVVKVETLTGQYSKSMIKK